MGPMSAYDQWKLRSPYDECPEDDETDEPKTCADCKHCICHASYGVLRFHSCTEVDEDGTGKANVAPSDEACGSFEPKEADMGDQEFDNPGDIKRDLLHQMWTEFDNAVRGATETNRKAALIYLNSHLSHDDRQAALNLLKGGDK